MRLSAAKILVTGGSGSLGRYLIKELLKMGAKNIISVSRDEGLIKEAEGEVQSKYVIWRVGDIADPNLAKRLLSGVKLIYHTAALKHVGIAERYPREVLKTNILGILNLLDQAEDAWRFINISSDKAIGVVNCYGASKLLGEYLVSETNTIFKGKFINIRCPNFFGSRGSVIDIWRRQIKANNTIEVTNPSMTRFFITIPDAAKFIVETSLQKDLDPSKIYYPLKPTKKFRLGDLARAFVEVFGDKFTKIKTIGIRSGEKLHEDYLSDVGLLTIGELKEFLKNLS